MCRLAKSPCHLSFLAPTARWHCPKHMALIVLTLFSFSVSVHMCPFTCSYPISRRFLTETLRQSCHEDVMDSHSACFCSLPHVALIALFWSHCQPSSPSRLGSNVSLLASGSSTVSTEHLPSGQKNYVWFSLAEILPTSNHSLRFPQCWPCVLYRLTTSVSLQNLMLHTQQQMNTWIQKSNPKFRVSYLIIHKKYNQFPLFLHLLTGPGFKWICTLINSRKIR